MRVIQNRFTTMGLLTFGLAGLLAPAACNDDDDRAALAQAGKGGGSGKGGSAGKGSVAGQSGEGGMSGAGASGGLSIDAPAAALAGSLKFAEELSDVVELGDFAVGFGKKNAYLIDFSDAAKPDSMSSFATKSAPVGAAFDATRKVAFVLATGGELQAFFLADPKSPSKATALDLKEKSALGLVRVGDRLYVLGKSGITPVTLNFDSSGALKSFKEEKVVTLNGTATHLAAGGGQLYVAYAGGTIDLFSATSAPKRNDTFELGGDVVGWVARGAQVFAAVKDIGLKVVDFAASSGPTEIYSASDVSDVQVFKRSGNLAVIGLARNVTVAFDVSDFAAPRALVSQAGAVPTWVAPTKGNFVLGSGKNLSVLGVPPFVSASVPTGLKSSFPRYGRIPLQLSKPVDPKTLSAKTVQLSCAGKVVETSLSVSPDNGRLTLLPTKTLPAGADCSVAFSGVKDPLGLAVSSPGPLGIQTSMASPGAVESKKSSYPHDTDGAFTGWKAGAQGDYEYKDVTAAQGMYSKFYADFDGKKLWILNDWFYNGAAIDPDCYNQFSVYTGGGSEYWDIRAYGDQHIEVRRNNQLLAEDDASVSGGYSHTATPNDAKAHTVYEIAVTTKPGSWSLALSDPGPTFACDQLETDPTTYDGQSDATKSSVDPTRVPITPQKPTPDRGGSGTLTTLTPTLSWTSGDSPGNFTVYLFELSRGDAFGSAAFKQWVYGQSFTLPAGLVEYGTTYTWRVTGYNLAGKTTSSSATFSVEKAVAIVAPKLTGAQPLSIVEDTATSLSLSGSGFVEGAQAFLDDTALATTFMASDSLAVMLSAQNTATPGDYTLTVRNAPDDVNTASAGLTITITVAQATECPHSECATGGRMPATCSVCATDTCADQAFAYCCTQQWDEACALRADGLKTCACDVDGGAAGGGGADNSGAGAGGTAGTGGTGGTGGTAGADAGASCAKNCSDTWPLNAGPTLCDDASMNVWQPLNSCACSPAICGPACSNACTNMVPASSDPTCADCISANCTTEYGNCLNDGTP